LKHHPSPDLRPIRDQTLQELEGKDLGDPPYNSHLVTEIHRLHRVPLKQFRIEDLRLMIGQGLGLPYLVPMALDHLEEHPFARGDFYRGDLLKNVAILPETFWLSHPHLRPRLIEALQRAVERVHKIDTLDELPEVLRDALTRHRGPGAA